MRRRHVIAGLCLALALPYFPGARAGEAALGVTWQNGDAESLRLFTHQFSLRVPPRTRQLFGGAGDPRDIAAVHLLYEGEEATAFAALGEKLANLTGDKSPLPLRRKLFFDITRESFEQTLAASALESRAASAAQLPDDPNPLGGFRERVQRRIDRLKERLSVPLFDDPAGRLFARGVGAVTDDGLEFSFYPHIPNWEFKAGLDWNRDFNVRLRYRPPRAARAMPPAPAAAAER